MIDSHHTTRQPSRQTFYVTTAPNKSVYYTKCRAFVKCLSVAQLILAWFPICLQLYSDLQGSYYLFCFGWWGGLIMLVAGSVGTAGAFKNRRSLIITHLVFNALLLPVCGILIAYLSFVLRDPVYGVIYAVGIIQFVLAIILIVFNSKAMCCNFINRHAAVVYQGYPPGSVMAAPVCGFVSQPGCAPPNNLIYPMETASNAKAPADPVAHLPAYSAQESKSSPPQYRELFCSF